MRGHRRANVHWSRQLRARGPRGRFRMSSRYKGSLSCLAKVWSSFSWSASSRDGWPDKSCVAPGFGMVGDLVIGIVGALIGAWALPQLGIHLVAGFVGAIINATIGAMLLLLIIKLVRDQGRWGGGWRGRWSRRW